MPESVVTPDDRWSSLPMSAKTTVLSLLARIIARGVVADDEEVGGDEHDR